MLGDEEIQAAVNVLVSRRTTMGEGVEQFEEEFARYVGAEHAVMVNSGSSADLLMAHATIPQPRRVLIPAVTWPTHVWAWHYAGYPLPYPILFVDVDGLNTTPEILMAAIEDEDDMVSLVHLMGVPCDINDLPCRITEDCCEALGADVGWLGEMATWSFFFSHHMTTMEGGAITTNDADAAYRLRSLRSHGWARHGGGDPYTFVGPGFNVRPTEIAAVIGLVQLRRLEEFNKLRSENHRAFVEILQGCPGIEIPDRPVGANPFGLPFFADNRNGLAAFLEKSGVETRPILGGNLARQPAFKDWECGRLPGADRVHDHGLFVGLHPQADSGVEQVAELILEYLAWA